MNDHARLFPEHYADHSLTGLRGEVWAMEPEACQGMFDSLAQIQNLSAIAIKEAAVATLRAQIALQSERLKVENNTAHIPVHGPIMRSVPWYFEWLGIAATSIDDTQAAVKAALEREDVDRIVLSVNSPGGTVNGLAELADVIFNGRSKKPIITHANGLMASAALYLGSQATEVLASPGTLVGSIGTLSVLHDSSKMAADLGIKVHVVRSGAHKGTGEPGAPISAKELEHWQHVVDSLADEFISALARGRGLKATSVKQIATGAIFTAEEALGHKLIDRIELSDGPAQSKPSEAPDGAEPETGEDDMSEKTTDPSPVDQTVLERLNAMEAKQADLEASAAKASARAEAAEAQLSAQKDEAKKTAIEAAVNEGRILPKAREKYEALADKLSLEELEGIVAELPVRTRAERKGGAAEQDTKDATFSDLDIASTAKALDLSVEEVVKAGTTSSKQVHGVNVIDFRQLQKDHEKQRRAQVNHVGGTR